MMRLTGQALKKFVNKAKLVWSFGQNRYIKSCFKGFEIYPPFIMILKVFYVANNGFYNPNSGSPFGALFWNIDAS